MQTKEARDKALDQYCEIMREIKLRASAIESAVNGDTKLHRILAQEFCFLQLRMICELVALACISAHGDLSAVSRLKTEWSADTILGQLDRLDKHFFPWPTKQGVDPQTKRPFMRDDDQRDCITKDELLKLYHLCGENLHRGRHRNIFEVKRSRIVSYDEIFSHSQRILNLLHGHTVVMERGGKAFAIYCILNAAPHGNVKCVALAELDSPPPQQPR